MANHTAIQWTDATWNPTRGCSRISEGCRNCYAERQAYRFSSASGRGRTAPTPFQGFVQMANGHPQWTGKGTLVEERLADPARWKTPKRIFVNSMSDLFHEALPAAAIDRVFAAMALSPQHTFQVLTKRGHRMLEYLSENHGHEARMRVQNVIDPPGNRGIIEVALRLYDAWPLPNVWLGVSVEDQKTADERIPLLLKTPASVRFVSYEPALGPVDFGKAIPCGYYCDGSVGHVDHGFITPGIKPRIDWIIVGGESGPGARPFDVAWARNTITQCKNAGVPCFVKQMGAQVWDRNDRIGDGSPREWPGNTDFDSESTDDYQGAPTRILLRDRKGGDMAEWPGDLRLREFPRVSGGER